MGVMVGTGPQSKELVGASGVTTSLLMTTAFGRCFSPRPPPRRGESPCDGASLRFGGAQSGIFGEGEKNSAGLTGFRPSWFGAGRVLKVIDGAGADAAEVLSRGCDRTWSKARFSRCADSSAFKAAAVVSAILGVILKMRLESGNRLSRAVGM